MALLVCLALLVGVVLWRMLFPPEPLKIIIEPGSGSDSFAAATALAMGERMGQSAEWTIATVLVIGSALIGLNWYQGDRRYQRDMEEIDSRIVELDRQIRDRLQVIELTSVATLSFLMFQGIAEKLGDPDKAGFVGRAIEIFRTASTQQQRQTIATILVEWANARRTSHPTLPIMADIPELRGFIPEIKAHFPALAQSIDEALRVAATDYS